MATSIEARWTFSPPSPSPHHWDDENHRMLQLMLGQVEHSRRTLDLLGGSSSSSSSFSSHHQQQQQQLESLELDLESPLPYGWEKCLDLKTGSIYYLNRSTGTSTRSDPRKPFIADLNTPASPSNSELTYEALSFRVADGKSSSKNCLGGNSVSALDGPQTAEGCLKLSLGLSVDLNCPAADQPLVASSTPATEQSLLADRSWFHKSAASSISSASSPSSTSVISFQDLDGSGESREKRKVRSTEVESSAADVLPAMMTVGCAKCLMFVMLSKSDPKCPRCGTSAFLDLPHPASKRSRFGCT